MKQMTSQSENYSQVDDDFKFDGYITSDNKSSNDFGSGPDAFFLKPK